MGTGSWKKLENNTSCLQLQTKIMAGIIVQWSQLLLGLSTNCWSRSCSLSLLTLLPGHYSVTDDFETTTVLIFLQGEIIISTSSLNAIQQISAALHIGEWSCKLLERGETGKLAPQLEMSTFFHRLAHLVLLNITTTLEQPIVKTDFVTSPSKTLSPGVQVMNALRMHKGISRLFPLLT